MFDKLSTENRQTLMELHRCASEAVRTLDILVDYRDIPECATAANKALDRMADHLEQLEFAMQRVWGFQQNSKYHTWWRFPKRCTCPRMDNLDKVFFGMGRFVSGACPIHGRVKND